MLGSLAGHESQAWNLQNNVLQVVDIVGVGSSLKALKNKGEGDGSEAFLDTCDAEKVQKSCKLCFMILEDQKLLSRED